VAKDLFATKHAQLNISVAVAFLCTQVKNPVKDDWKSLTQLFHYLHGMEEPPLILCLNFTTIGKLYYYWKAVVG
jgi:hypothetical protein